MLPVLLRRATAVARSTALPRTSILWLSGALSGRTVPCRGFWGSEPESNALVQLQPGHAHPSTGTPIPSTHPPVTLLSAVTTSRYTLNCALCCVALWPSPNDAAKPEHVGVGLAVTL